MGRVDGRVAIVTGAARGTGEQTARLLAAEGAQVVIADVLEPEGKAVAGDIGAAARFERLDVTDEAAWTRVIDETTASIGAPTILVNNAGLLHMAALVDTAAEDVERLWRVNQLGPFLGMKTIAPAMHSAGGGSIVNVASVDGLSAKNGLSAYAATKWALRGLTRVAALELGQ
ncbi:MAG: SDR family NAD(P)-dependent oxidoreductase, partial [Deltaproteobacteria bacterium]|nr:SDR family NAD(P)-dependent oxidoreductase [Deltaproteobacteria bacterium]